MVVGSKRTNSPDCAAVLRFRSAAVCRCRPPLPTRRPLWPPVPCPRLSAPRPGPQTLTRGFTPGQSLLYSPDLGRRCRQPALVAAVLRPVVPKAQRPQHLAIEVALIVTAGPIVSRGSEWCSIATRYHVIVAPDAVALTAACRHKVVARTHPSSFRSIRAGAGRVLRRDRSNSRPRDEDAADGILCRPPRACPEYTDT